MKNNNVVIGIILNAIEIIILILVCISYFDNKPNINISKQKNDNTAIIPQNDDKMEEIIVMQEIEINQDTITETQYDEYNLQEIYYIAQCVQSEAGNQCELGKRLVCDVILNRFDLEGYESYADVINEPNQFEVVSNNSINCTPTDETYQIVLGELENRTNYEVLYFRTSHYHTFGTPLFQVQDHYFSK